MKALAALITVLATSETLACSCAELDLEQQFESSPNVFTAVVTAAKFDSEGHIEADFEVTEVFKGTIPFDKLRTRREGTTCDTSIAVGPEYLFFLGDKGMFGLCSGHKGVNPLQPSPQLQLLRAYASGQTTDLSSPWWYEDTDGVCGVGTNFTVAQGRGQGFLQARYRYGESKSAPGPDETQMQVGVSRVVFIVAPYKKTTREPIQVETRQRKFTATWTEFPIPEPLNVYDLENSQVGAFVRELTLSDAATMNGDPAIDGTLIRTTNAGDAIERFLMCLDH